jgi:nucleoside-diphosphate-sugar epimerase
MKRAFVTGGSGFVGRALIPDLRRRGAQVAALARSDGAERIVVEAGASCVRGDLEDDAALETGMKGCDVVFHAAAKVEVWGKREDFERVTIEGTRRVMAAAKRAGVGRVVHVSTEAVLIAGSALVNADETVPLPRRPLGLYAWSKGRAEEIAREAGAVIVRPRAIWGQGDTVLLPRMLELAKQGKFAWIGGGNHLTSTCHVRNLCEAMVLAAEKGRPGEIYFVTDGPPIEMRAFYGEMARRAGGELGKKSVPRWIARAGAWVMETTWKIGRFKGEPFLSRAAVHFISTEVTVDDSKARRELGYVPVVSREQGLDEIGPRP